MKTRTRGIKYPPDYKIYRGTCSSCKSFVEIDFVGNDPGVCPRCKKPLSHCRWCGSHISKKDKPFTCPTCGRKIRRTKK